MKLPKRPTEKWEYTPEKYDGVTITLKPLKCDDFDSCSSMFIQNEQSKALRKAAYCGVVGWSGFDEEFSLDALKLLDDAFIYELGGEALRGSQLSETEKN